VVARRALVRSFWPHPALAAEWASAVPEGTEVAPRRAHLLKLDGGWDSVWSNRFTASRRRGVRHAERSGVTVERGTSGHLLPEFYKLLTLATTRWARMQHEPRWLTLQRLRRRDPLRKFEAIADALGERFRIWLACVDGRPVAGIVVLQGLNAYYFRGAMDESMKRYGANNLLMSRSIEDACGAGCQNYYLGDTGWSPSAADFKERFGGLAYDYSQYRLEKLPFSAAERAAKSIVKRALRFRDF
jgi:lipid II:glycine glycyltransferase (peptidoglycan interpeptide bridge formation enzyme)